eukprot:ANDGO_00608.mRNA.1 hypothetical protein
MEDYLAFDFNSNPQWIEYKARIELPPGQEWRIQRYMQRWYVSNVEPNVQFDERSHPQAFPAPKMSSSSTSPPASDASASSSSASSSSGASSSSPPPPRRSAEPTSRSTSASSAGSTSSGGQQPVSIVALFCLLHLCVLVCTPLSLLTHVGYETVQGAALLTYAASVFLQTRHLFSSTASARSLVEKLKTAVPVLQAAMMKDDGQYIVFAFLFYWVGSTYLSFAALLCSVVMHVIFALYGMSVRFQALVQQLRGRLGESGVVGKAASFASKPLATRLVQLAARTQRMLDAKPLMQYVHTSWIVLFAVLVKDVVFGLLLGGGIRGGLTPLVGVVLLIRWRAHTVPAFAGVANQLLGRIPVLGPVLVSHLLR